MALCSETPRLDAELLLAHCLGKPRSYLYSWPERLLAPEIRTQFQQLINRRMKPTPIAYLLGQREFFSLDFKTTPAALIPRSETELLVETVLDLYPANAAIRVLELGTGTGAISVALKKNRPGLDLLATDLSPDCLALARENAERHAVSIDWLLSDWYSNINPARIFDVIVSNPPYIAADSCFLLQGDLPAEPRTALSPGDSGLEALQQIIAGASTYLKPSGYLLLEHGFDQSVQVDKLMKTHGFTEIECKIDLNDLPRMSLGKLI